jgi:hypothetical protein
MFFRLHTSGKFFISIRMSCFLAKQSVFIHPPHFSVTFMRKYVSIYVVSSKVAGVGTTYEVTSRNDYEIRTQAGCESHMSTHWQEQTEQRQESGSQYTWLTHKLLSFHFANHVTVGLMSEPGFPSDKLSAIWHSLQKKHNGRKECLTSKFLTLIHWNCLMSTLLHRNVGALHRLSFV